MMRLFGVLSTSTIHAITRATMCSFYVFRLQLNSVYLKHFEMNGRIENIRRHGRVVLYFYDDPAARQSK